MMKRLLYIGFALLLTSQASAQFLQINRKDGIKEKVLTSFVDSVTFVGQYIHLNKKDNIVEKIHKSLVDSMTVMTDTSGKVIDIDGNMYSTITIGTQVWMQENLKTTRYANGTPLEDGATAGDITGNYTSKYFFSYNNNDSNVAIYGRLYTWAAVMNGATSSNTIPSGIQGVCPTGWHIPSDAEWCILENFVEINTDPSCNLGGSRGTNTGGKMKETGTTHWNSPNSGADNSSGFTALPGGYRTYNGTFNYVGCDGYLWSAAENGATSAWSRDLDYGNSGSSRYNYDESYGFSVRCVKD